MKNYLAAPASAFLLAFLCGCTSWSPDGKKVTFCEKATDNRCFAAVLDLETGKAVRLCPKDTHFNNVWCRYTPDGKHLVVAQEMVDYFIRVIDPQTYEIKLKKMTENIYGSEDEVPEDPLLIGFAFLEGSSHLWLPYQNKYLRFSLEDGSTETVDLDFATHLMFCGPAGIFYMNYAVSEHKRDEVTEIEVCEFDLNKRAVKSSRKITAAQAGLKEFCPFPAAVGKTRLAIACIAEKPKKTRLLITDMEGKTVSLSDDLSLISHATFNASESALFYLNREGEYYDLIEYEFLLKKKTVIHLCGGEKDRAAEVEPWEIISANAGTCLALSPDGKKLAISMMHLNLELKGAAQLYIVDLEKPERPIARYPAATAPAQ